MILPFWFLCLAGYKRGYLLINVRQGHIQILIHPRLTWTKTQTKQMK